MPLLALLLLAGAEPPRWPDTPLARVTALAALEALQVRLLTQDSATLVLDEWCASHQLAPAGSTIVADRVTGADKPATPEIRAALRVAADEPVRYRRVRLMCGARMLSSADNWYVPGRLTPAMNATLDTSDTAFGRVVRPLNFTRRTLSSTLLWPPLTRGWESRPGPARRGALRIPPALIENRGLLSLPDGQPISLVVETYSNQVLAFAPPR